MFKLSPTVVPRLGNYQNCLGSYQIKIFESETWESLNLKSSIGDFNEQFSLGSTSLEAVVPEGTKIIEHFYKHL